MTGWTYIGNCTDGQRFEITPSVNVWDHTWVQLFRDPPPPPTGDHFIDMNARRQTALVKDPQYGNENRFNIYEIPIGSLRIVFAAGEFSNGIWGFYVPERIAGGA